MTSSHSRQRTRFYRPRRSAQNYKEPPPNGSIPATDVEQGPEDWWGHQLGNKKQGTIRLILQNVDGIPTHEDGDIKLDCLHHFARENQADIIALTELNMAWDKVPYEARLPRKTRGWWEACHWSVSHNKRDKHGSSFQPGGTAIAVLNDWAHRVTRPGDDPTGLG